MIKVDLKKCTGCRRCEVACSFFHTGRVSRELARIKVLNLYETGIDGAVICVQCKERYCLKCPEDALSLGQLGQVVVSPTVCTLCGVCEKACPIGAVEIFNGIVFVCDLCGGIPKCVEACTEGAIVFAKDEQGPSLRAIEKETGRMEPGQKRLHWLKKQGSLIRDRWSRKHA